MITYHIINFLLIDNPVFAPVVLLQATGCKKLKIRKSSGARCTKNSKLTVNKIDWINGLQSVALSPIVGSRTDQHTRRHPAQCAQFFLPQANLSGHTAGVLQSGSSSNGTPEPSRAVHYRGVTLNCAFPGEVGAEPCVCDGTVFEKHHSLCRCV